MSAVTRHSQANLPSLPILRLFWHMMLVGSKRGKNRGTKATQSGRCGGSHRHHHPWSFCAFHAALRHISHRFKFWPSNAPLLPDLNRTACQHNIQHHSISAQNLEVAGRAAPKQTRLHAREDEGTRLVSRASDVWRNKFQEVLQVLQKQLGLFQRRKVSALTTHQSQHPIIE